MQKSFTFLLNPEEVSLLHTAQSLTDEKAISGRKTKERLARICAKRLVNRLSECVPLESATQIEITLKMLPQKEVHLAIQREGKFQLTIAPLGDEILHQFFSEEQFAKAISSLLGVPTKKTLESFVWTIS